MDTKKDTKYYEFPPIVNASLAISEEIKDEVERLNDVYIGTIKQLLLHNIEGVRVSQITQLSTKGKNADKFVRFVHPDNKDARVVSALIGDFGTNYSDKEPMIEADSASKARKIARKNNQ